ncbi:cytochrome p450 monooxygenase pc-3 [Moniliophthora roreri]|nr:cytochrome p450 monooxygenase pc-3 [Moniliophthora roreri]
MAIENLKIPNTVLVEERACHVAMKSATLDSADCWEQGRYDPLPSELKTPVPRRDFHWEKRARRAF